MTKSNTPANPPRAATPAKPARGNGTVGGHPPADVVLPVVPQTPKPLTVGPHPPAAGAAPMADTVGAHPPAAKVALTADLVGVHPSAV